MATIRDELRAAIAQAETGAPQAPADAELAKAQGERDFWRRSYQEQIAILENLDPRMDGTEDLLKALREIDAIGALLYPDGADVMDDNPFAGQVSEMWRIAATAIAQAKTGAARIARWRPCAVMPR